MLKQIIKFCETLLKVKEVFKNAYGKSLTQGSDSYCECFDVYEDDYDEYIILSDAQGS